MKVRNSQPPDRKLEALQMAKNTVMSYQNKSVSSKWELPSLPQSSLELWRKERARRQLSFWWKTLILIGHYGIVIHRKVFPSWVHLSYILGPRFVRTKFPPPIKTIVRHPPLGYFIAQHLPPLQSWSRPATCWAGKYPPSGGKPHAHLLLVDE